MIEQQLLGMQMESQEKDKEEKKRRANLIGNFQLWLHYKLGVLNDLLSNNSIMLLRVGHILLGACNVMIVMIVYI